MKGENQEASQRIHHDQISVNEEHGNVRNPPQHSNGEIGFQPQNVNEDRTPSIIRKGKSIFLLILSRKINEDHLIHSTQKFAHLLMPTS